MQHALASPCHHQLSRHHHHRCSFPHQQQQPRSTRRNNDRLAAARCCNHAVTPAHVAAPPTRHRQRRRQLTATITAAAVAADQPDLLPPQQQEPHTSSNNSTDSTTSLPPLQVTRHNFAQALHVLQAALASCQFYAFDCEMSGLHPAGTEDYVSDDVDDRYTKTAAGAESFLVTQMGLSLFTWREGGDAGSSGHYEARSFNFHLFPSPSEELDLRFSCQASSLAFLASHGFDFNKMVYEGIPFLPLSLRDKQLKAAADAHRAAATPPSLDDLDDDERCLMQELEETISTWLNKLQPPPQAVAAAATSSSDVLHLPAPAPQLMALQRRLLAAGIGSSRWGSSSSRSKGSGSSSSSTGGAGGWQYVVEAVEGSTVLRRATPEQVAAAAAQSKQQRQQQATAAAGFSHVLELLRDSGKPAVGHNVRFDVAFILAAFVQNPLPKTWSGFKQLVGTWFPGGVYDTKYLARSLTGLGVPGSTALLPDTGLGPLFKPFCVSACSQQPMGTVGSLSSTGDSAPRVHSVNSAGLTEWLEQRTSALDDPDLWTVLPSLHQAPGCEQYVAAAAATAGLSQQQSQQQSSQPQPQPPPADSGQPDAAAAAAAAAHEAGFDALMTGVVFVGLMRLHEISALSSLSRWMLPAAPQLPPQLGSVEDLANRQHFAKSKDIVYAALQGSDVMPQRPHVVYITGFKGTRPRWQDIQMRCSKQGLGKPVVSFVREGTAIKGAYVVLQSAKDAAKAIQLLRQSTAWTVMTYADYFQSKVAATDAPARPAPPSIIVTQ